MPVDLDALRTRLGLAADADEDAINAALAVEPPPAGGAGGEGGGPEGGSPEGGREGEPPPQASSLTQTVSREVFNDMQQRLERAEESLAARQAREDREGRDSLVAAAVVDGRIAPAERDEWRKALDESPKATADLLGKLTPNKIPVAARSSEQAEGTAGDGEGTGWFPQLDKTEA